MMKSFAIFLSLTYCVLATSRTSAPSGCLIVSKSATSGQYDTVQSAVNALSTTSTSSQCIWINEGTYEEQVTVPARKAQLIVYGYTTDTATYADNAVTITSSLAAADGLSDEDTATLIVLAENFVLYNVNVANGYGEGSQAVALAAYQSSGYYGCSFTGYQDTLLAETGDQIYGACYIEGATDFIFGQHAAAWFEQCDIGVLDASWGTVTANGRASSTDPSYYCFNSCNVAAASGQDVPDGAYYLGRPWSEYARVVFQWTYMSDVINSAGWTEWSSSEPNTEDVLFGEYDNSGAGSEGTRASFATKLTAGVSIDTVLGSSYTSYSFYDSSYF